MAYKDPAKRNAHRRKRYATDLAHRQRVLEYQRAYNKKRPNIGQGWTRRNFERGKKIREALLEGGCVQCGETDRRCLQFHHRDPETKDFCVSASACGSRSKERLEAEIAKCDILCANCHCKITYGS